MAASSPSNSAHLLHNKAKNFVLQVEGAWVKGGKKYNATKWLPKAGFPKVGNLKMCGLYLPEFPSQHSWIVVNIGKPCPKVKLDSCIYTDQSR